MLRDARGQPVRTPGRVEPFQLVVPASGFERGLGDLRGARQGVPPAGSSSHGRDHISATRKIFLIGSRTAAAAWRPRPARPGTGPRAVRPATSPPATITRSGWPSSSIAREPTRVVPLRRNQPPDGSPPLPSGAACSRPLPRGVQRAGPADVGVQHPAGHCDDHPGPAGQPTACRDGQVRVRAAAEDQAAAFRDADDQPFGAATRAAAASARPPLPSCLPACLPHVAGFRCAPAFAGSRSPGIASRAPERVS